MSDTIIANAETTTSLEELSATYNDLLACINKLEKLRRQIATNQSVAFDLYNSIEFKNYLVTLYAQEAIVRRTLAQARVEAGTSPRNHESYSITLYDLAIAICNNPDINDYLLDDPRYSEQIITHISQWRKIYFSELIACDATKGLMLLAENIDDSFQLSNNTASSWILDLLSKINIFNVNIHDLIVCINVTLIILSALFFAVGAALITSSLVLIPLFIPLISAGLITSTIAAASMIVLISLGLYNSRQFFDYEDESTDHEHSKIFNLDSDLEASFPELDQVVKPQLLLFKQLIKEEDVEFEQIKQDFAAKIPRPIAPTAA